MGKLHTKDGITYVPHNTIFSKVRDLIYITVFVIPAFLMLAWVINMQLYDVIPYANGVESTSYEYNGGLDFKDFSSPIIFAPQIVAVSVLVAVLIKSLYSEFPPNLFRYDGPMWLIFLLPFGAILGGVILSTPFIPFVLEDFEYLTTPEYEESYQMLIAFGSIGNYFLISLLYLCYIKVLFSKKGLSEYRMFDAETEEEYIVTDDGEDVFVDH